MVTPLILAALLSDYSADLPFIPYTEELAINAKGQQVIARTAEYPDLDGGTVKVTQYLRRLGPYSYEVDPVDQPAATRVYHLALCEEKDMKPSRSKEHLGGDLAVGGFSCCSGTEPVEERAPSTR